MENASKALIIAGAILLSILIIGLGMAVYNNATSATGNSDLSSQEVTAHNATFEAYEGRIKGSQVRSLLNAIKKNNKEYEDRKIFVEATDAANETIGELSNVTNESSIGNSITDVGSSTTYEVTFTYNGNDGLIDTCAIEVYN